MAIDTREFGVLAAGAATCGLRVGYERLQPGPLPADVLAVIGFGADAALPEDPRCLRVNLQPLRGAGLSEVWRGNGRVHCGREGAIRYACDDHHLFGALELDETAFGGITGAAQAAYAQMRVFHQRAAHPHLLRVWNYCDAINAGSGDAERYREFCVGRAAGLAQERGERLPAATAIGRRDGSATLQVYWLAAREPGQALENPRQISAYRYPRQYGLAAPSFSRAMLAGDGALLLISGTASVVGHASHHPDDTASQLAETLTNLEALRELAASRSHVLPRAFGAATALKVYLRDAHTVAAVDAALRVHLPDSSYIILAGDICRSDLLVEIDGVHGAVAN